MQRANDDAVAVGLDLGTGGARAVAVSLTGQRVAAARSDFPPPATRVAGVTVEQDPRAWSTAAGQALQGLTAAIAGHCEIVGVAVCATSGTFLLADENGQPLTQGIMYNDLRAADLASEVAQYLRDHLAPYGIQIAATFALPKIVHLARHQPQRFRQCRHVVHQTDWVTGMLCGRLDVTDVSTALKTGVDPGGLAWPGPIERVLGVPRDRLPRVVLPGTPIGQVTPAAAVATGLPAGTPVIAGCTDGTAGFLASGANRPGDVNVTLGTTLVLKAVARRPLMDPDGAVYNHRHPAGGYLPGAASNTGGDWLPSSLPGADLAALGRQAADLLPTGRIVYPLVKTGERFPFACRTATGFGLQQIEQPAERFAAGMEGVAFIERMAIERLESLGLMTGPTVFATGGGVAGETWLRIRAAINGRVYCVPRYPECAVGAAVLAAVPHLGGCQQACEAMIRTGHNIEPDADLARAYAPTYDRFRSELRQRGYL